jgi:hypothetical protein
MIDLLLENPLLLLFVVLGVGYRVGRITVGGFSLGISAVLFVGLAFGPRSRDAVARCDLPARADPVPIHSGAVGQPRVHCVVSTSTGPSPSLWSGIRLVDLDLGPIPEDDGPKPVPFRLVEPAGGIWPTALASIGSIEGITGSLMTPT